MPAYLRGVLRDVLTFVKVGNGGLFYGFKAKDLTAIPGVGAADVTALGHMSVTSLPATRIAVIGANSPKPPRVTKTLVRRPSATVQGSTSTFCATDKISAALAEGWQTTNGGRGVMISNGRSITVGARLASGGIYLFPMNSVDATTYAATLGLILPANLSATERSQSFSGTNKPKPAIVSKSLPNGSFRSFCSFDKLDDALAGEGVGTGFALLKGEIASSAPSVSAPTPP
jgi:hypothetical protein